LKCILYSIGKITLASIMVNSVCYFKLINDSLKERIRERLIRSLR